MEYILNCNILNENKTEIIILNEFYIFTVFSVDIFFQTENLEQIKNFVANNYELSTWRNGFSAPGRRHYEFHLV